MIAQGVPGTSAPAFAQQVGGPLTDKQIDILVEGMRSRWGKAENFKNLALPPYSLQDASAKGSGPGDSQRGAAAYQTYCAQCHGKDGSGGPKGGSVINPAYLALVSDQALRTAVIVGRSDLGMPDWRANILWPTHESARDFRCGGVARVTPTGRSARTREAEQGEKVTDAGAVKSGEAATTTKMDTTTKRAKSTKEEKIVSRFDSSFSVRSS